MSDQRTLCLLLQKLVAGLLASGCLGWRHGCVLVGLLPRAKCVGDGVAYVVVERRRCVESECSNVIFCRWPYIWREVTESMARLSTSQYITIHDQQPDVTYHSRRIEEPFSSLENYTGMV